jgi:tRNA A37 threonylcarbamoyladenosine dehydratase
MRYTLSALHRDDDIFVVGCGGTGGFVAEGLCRLLVGKKADIILVDHDRVERHNLKRQCFYESDMGKPHPRHEYDSPADRPPVIGECKVCHRKRIYPPNQYEGSFTGSLASNPAVGDKW